ncbi:N-acetyltransferase family protein [Catenovulum sp. SM1970]|uniref:GNAT family N-acetyltransferase n=1 Tax=Marinifaba aquimaris TaxID=2741323 RepID=UPI001573BC33|nr:GNAT family N-acetyltransferase [Marinifaba aquimaris]NTS77316.1 N-acetyltransferase family protein [Marinifaba aquimaris]
MIRKATNKDLAPIVDIYNQSIPSRLATADTEPKSISEFTAWFTSHHPMRPIFVYEQDNQCVAWLSFKDFYGRPAYQSTAEISIYVATSAIGQGIGTTLLSHALSICPELNIERLLAFIFSHNTASIELFKKFGFTAWGELPDVAEMDDKKYSLSILGLKVNQ